MERWCGVGWLVVSVVWRVVSVVRRWCVAASIERCDYIAVAGRGPSVSVAWRSVVPILPSFWLIPWPASFPPYRALSLYFHPSNPKSDALLDRTNDRSSLVHVTDWAAASRTATFQVLVLISDRPTSRLMAMTETFDTVSGRS